MIDFAADLAAILADGLAKDAVLTPVGGSPVSLRVIPRFGDVDADIGQFAQGILAVAVFTTAAVGLQRPSAGASLIVSGVTYTLVADARRDARGLTWEMTGREAS